MLNCLAALLRGRDPSTDKLWRSSPVVRATLATVHFMLTSPPVPLVTKHTRQSTTTNINNDNNNDVDDPDADVVHSTTSNDDDDNDNVGANDDSFQSFASDNEDDEEDDLNTTVLFDVHQALLESRIIHALGYVALDAAYQSEAIEV